MRTIHDPTTLIPNLRSIVAQPEPDAALTNVFTMEGLVAMSIARPRFYAALIGVLGVLAAVLASIGIYGVISVQRADQADRDPEPGKCGTLPKHQRQNLWAWQAPIRDRRTESRDE